MKKRSEPVFAAVMGKLLILLAAISLLILFDNLPELYSGFITKVPPPYAVQTPGFVVHSANPPLSALNKQLLLAEDDYRNGPVEARVGKLQPMVDAAKARQDMMLSLMDENPSAVLDNAFGADVRAVLSTEVQLFLEHEVDVEGNISILHGDDFVNNVSMNFHTLQTPAGEKLQLHFLDQGPFLLSRSYIRVHGLQIGNDIIIKSSASPDLEVVNSVPTGHTVKKVAVLLFNYQSAPYQPYTIDQARHAVFTADYSNNAFYKESSFGKLSLEGKLRPDGDVFGWFSLNITPRCSMGNVGGEYDLALSNGVNLSGYDNIVYYHSNWCPFQLGELGGPNSYLYGYGMFEGVLNHELGHNFGLVHANSYRCYDSDARNFSYPYNGWFAGGVPVPISPYCKTFEYGDPYDTMGSLGTHHNNAYEKERLNWFATSNKLDVTTEGDYTVYPLEYPTSGVQTLRIVKKIDKISGKYSATTYYYVEFRQPSPQDHFDPSDYEVNGISIHLAPDQLSGSSIIDTTTDYKLSQTYPDGTLENTTFYYTNFVNSALPAGRTFEDHYTGISIKTVSISPSSAVVHVAFPKFADIVPPEVVLNMYGTVGGIVPVSIYAADTLAANNTGVVKVELYADGALAGTSTSGSKNTYTINWDSKTVADGPHVLSVKAYDAAGNVGTTSSAKYGSGAYFTVDNTPPSVVETIPLLGGSTAAAGSTLTIAAAVTDNSAIAKVLFNVGNRVSCTDFIAPYTCSWQVPKGAGKPYQITATAYDAAGNVGASQIITITSV